MLKVVVKSKTKEKQVAKSKTSDRDAVGLSPEFGDRESGDSGAGVTKETSEAGAKLRAKTVSTSHENNLNVLIIVAGRVSLVSFQMTFDLL